MRRRVRASSAPNGSSRRSTSGPRARARASDARCAIPPETSAGRRSAAWSSPTRRSRSATRSRASRFAVPRGRPSATFCAIVRHGSRRGSWKATAVRSSVSRTAEESSVMVPRDGWSRPPRSLSRVDLPHPEGPTIARISPAARSRSTSLSTACSPCGVAKARDRPVRRTTPREDCAVAAGTAGARRVDTSSIMPTPSPPPRHGRNVTKCGVRIRERRSPRRPARRRRSRRGSRTPPAPRARRARCAGVAPAPPDPRCPDR